MAHSGPKYLFLVNWIKDQLTQGELKYGDKLYSENELCTIFGISRQTVRQAIGILEQEHYLERHRGSGTYITYNQHSMRTRTKKIGVISTYVGEYIFTNILKSIESVLTADGYTMQLTFTHDRVENERRALQIMIESNVDGIIVEPTKSGLPNPNVPLYHDIVNRGIPILFFNAAYPGEDFPLVSLNDLAAGELAANHLIQRGHKSIGAILQSDDIQGRLRYEGFMQALLKAGVGIYGEHVFWFAAEDIEELASYPDRILNRFKDCTALVCYNDQIAVKLARIFKQEGINIPERLSLVSIDNSDAAALCDPPLTSIDNPTELLGSTVARHILALVEDEDFNAGRQFEPSLVERSSVRSLTPEEAGEPPQPETITVES